MPMFHDRSCPVWNLLNSFSDPILFRRQFFSWLNTATPVPTIPNIAWIHCHSFPVAVRLGKFPDFPWWCLYCLNLAVFPAPYNAPQTITPQPDGLPRKRGASFVRPLIGPFASKVMRPNRETPTPRRRPPPTLQWSSMIHGRWRMSRCVDLDCLSCWLNLKKIIPNRKKTKHLWISEIFRFCLIWTREHPSLQIVVPPVQLSVTPAALVPESWSLPIPFGFHRNSIVSIFPAQIPIPAVYAFSHSRFQSWWSCIWQMEQPATLKRTTYIPALNQNTTIRPTRDSHWSIESKQLFPPHSCIILWSGDKKPGSSIFST